MTAEPPVKCVAWDLDETVWPGVVLESADLAIPDPDGDVLALIATLERRGIVSSVASRNPPDLLAQIERHPLLAGRFVAPQLGWGGKDEALRRIAAELDVGLDSLALVDNDAFQRAAVAAAAPEVLVLSTRELAERLDDPRFAPGELTEEAQGRVASYRRREERVAMGRAFAGTHEEFLRSCEIVLKLSRAGPEDAPRLMELARRTTQFNSTGRRHSRAELERRLVVAARLRDRFGDEGLVGAAVVAGCDEPEPQVELLMVSCRAAGRGVVTSLLGAVLRHVRRAGAARLVVPCRITDRNLPLRISLRELGFRAAGAGEAGVAVFARSLADPPPAYPRWATVVGDAGFEDG